MGSDGHSNSSILLCMSLLPKSNENEGARVVTTLDSYILTENGEDLFKNESARVIK